MIPNIIAIFIAETWNKGHYLATNEQIILLQQLLFVELLPILEYKWSKNAGF